MHRRKGLGLILILIAGIPLALAQPRALGQAVTPGPGADLSPDQKAHLRSIMDDAKRDTENLYRRLRAERRDLARLFGNYDLDERRATELMRQINDLQNTIMQRHLRTQRELRRVVSAAQFEQLKKFMRTVPWNDHGLRGPRPDHPSPRPSGPPPQ